ncbi:hypothetical protein [Humibacter ginsengisoli]
MADGTHEDDDRFSWRRGAISWMTVRLLAAVVIAATVLSWGYNYVYETSPEFADVVVTSDERFGQFEVTAIGLAFFGCVPAILAILVELTGSRRTWVRTVIAATAPNVLGAIGFWCIVWAGGLGPIAALLALILAALGSTTFFVALTPRTPLRRYAP